MADVSSNASGLVTSGIFPLARWEVTVLPDQEGNVFACVRSQPFPYLGFMNSELTSRRVKADCHDNYHDILPIVNTHASIPKSNLYVSIVTGKSYGKDFFIWIWKLE